MDALFYFNQGVVKLQNKDRQGAIADFTKSIELNSSISKRTITDAGPDGSTISTNVFDICEGEVNTYYNRGCAYFDLGQYAEALYDLTKIIEYAPEDAEAHFRSGMANYCLRNNAAMRVDVANAYRLDPKYSHEYFLSLFQH